MTQPPPFDDFVLIAIIGGGLYGLIAPRVGFAVLLILGALYGLVKAFA